MLKQPIFLLGRTHAIGNPSHAAVIRTLSNKYPLKVETRPFSSTPPTRRILESPGEVINGPPFTEETARKKVNAAQDRWNTMQPQEIAKAYTENSIWRNRDQFVVGHAEIVEFLTKKWEKEKDYRLRKELFCWQEEKIAVQFWYEYRDAHDGMKWKRCYGLEDWTFDVDGRMRKRQMSGNDVELKDGERWFVEGKNVEEAEIGDKHW